MADADKSSKRRRPVAKPPALAAKSPKPRKPAMTESESSADSVFEIERIRRLVELMKEHDLSEVDLRESRQRIRICRGPKEAARPAGPTYSAVQNAPAISASPAAPVGPAADAANIVTIKSPMVGTFYCRPNPKAEAYVKVGSQVDTTTVICIIEAMKVFNEIPAEVRGRIVSVLVEDGEAVEFDKPLFKVDTGK